MSACPNALWPLLPMQLAHLDEVLAIEVRAYPVAWSRGIFEDCLRVGYSAWVLTDAGAAVRAYALMSLAAGEAHLLNLCVAPEWQRRGLACRLLDHLLRLARQAACEQMMLEVRVSNTAAFALYQRYGFRQIGLRKGYYPTPDRRGEDGRVLALSLSPS